MIKEKYRDIPDDEFVPLTEGIDAVFWVSTRLIN